MTQTEPSLVVSALLRPPRYLGQRGTTKLAAKGGVEVPANYKYPHPDMCTIKHENHAQCLKLIQEAMKGDKADEVKKIYETVGTYLGYALAGYEEFYKIDHVMILGRVSKGKGGDIMLETAKKVGAAVLFFQLFSSHLFNLCSHSHSLIVLICLACLLTIVHVSYCFLIVLFPKWLSTLMSKC